MDALPLHPKLVHLPIALAVIMPLVTSGLLIAWFRDWLPRRAWAIVVGLQLMLVGTGFAAMQTGESDEEVVEDVVPDSAIEAHEEAAEVFFWSAVGVLVIAAAAIVVPAPGAALAAGSVALLGTIVVLALGIRVGEAGGKLVYEHDAGAAWSQASASGAPAIRSHDEDEEHDED